MAKKEIYIIRHGQTDFNLKKIVQGRGVDSELNTTGQQQAKAFFDHYKHIEFDHIFISELQRTKQTVQNFIDLEIPHTKLASLDEINWGIYEGVSHSPEMKKNTKTSFNAGEMMNCTSKLMEEKVLKIFGNDNRLLLLY
ncbi:MAG: histidine phosphatase family protein [Chitinophagales bacterium]